MGAACARRCCPAWRWADSSSAGGLHRSGPQNQSTVGDLPEFLPQVEASPASTFLDPFNGSKGSSDGVLESRTSADDVFFSMLSDTEFSQAILSVCIRSESTKKTRSSVSSGSAVRRPKRPPQNANKISSYGWLEAMLRFIADGAAAGVGLDMISQPQRAATPLFVVAGTCPSSVAGMQAVTYFGFDDGSIDLWWVKPKKADASQFDHGTLNLQNRGQLKNDMGGRARAVYQPLADKFADQGTVEGDFTFGIDKVCGRAFVEDRTATAAGEGRMMLYLVWQEHWSSGILGKKFIAGKLAYQKAAGTAGQSPAVRYFSRQYKITNGELFVAPREEEEVVPTLLPPDSFQEMYDMDI